MQNIIKMEQVHGNNVVRVTVKDVGKTIPNCDALITNDPEVTLEVRVADCLPISVIDKKGRGVGLIHAGWRGLDNRIIENSIRMMSQKFGIQNSEFVINIGPHICQKCYEAKEDITSKFAEYPDTLSERDGRKYLDLAKIAEQQLIGFGIKKENIFIDQRCTFEDLSLHSYRRNKTANRNVVTLSCRGRKNLDV